MNAPRFGASEALAAGVVAAMVLAWVVSAGRVPAYLLPPPLDVLRAVAGFFTQPERLEHLVATFAHIGASIALSFVLGAALAQQPCGPAGGGGGGGAVELLVLTECDLVAFRLA